MKVQILMSTYNGEKYLAEQLESIFAQSQSDISLLVRDDESSDKTQEILKEYADDGKLSWYTGKNLGCAKSFWHLLCNCEQADYYAFCDQDDVWDIDKIKTAADMLDVEDNDVPLLYFCDVRVTDENLNVKYKNMVESFPIDYPHSLIRNIAPGCTYVFNNKLRELLKQYDCDKYGIDIHDWTVYKIALCFGKVIFDKNTHMSYRQHGNNAIGAAPKGAAYLVNSLKHFFSAKFKNIRSENAYRLENCYGEHMNEKNKYVTYIMAHYSESLKNKRSILKCSDFKFKGFKYQCFKIRILINRL